LAHSKILIQVIPNSAADHHFTRSIRWSVDVGKHIAVSGIEQLASASGASFASQEVASMRSAVHNVPVQFRANMRLLTAARAKADREGMSLSELMRSALRREIAHAER
jgi:hypothetical protein